MKIDEICEEFDPYQLHNLQNPSSKEVTAVKKVARLAEIIEKNCAEMLSAYRSSGKVLYRGMHSTDDAVVTRIRPNRKAVQMNNDFHDALHQGFIAAGLTATRTNSIFCTANKHVASSWGSDVYVIFVKDGWSGTIFTHIKNDYAFYTMYDIARSYVCSSAPNMKSFVSDIKREGAKNFSTANELSNILFDSYYDILITGDSYIAVKCNSKLYGKLIKKLDI